MTDKPSKDEGLGRIWAKTGGTADPDTIENDKVTTGWIQEKPPFEFMNWIQKFCTKFIDHINTNGIVTWDSETTYPKNAIVKASDGKTYKNRIEDTGTNPTEETVKIPIWTAYPSIYEIPDLSDINANTPRVAQSVGLTLTDLKKQNTNVTSRINALTKAVEKNTSSLLPKENRIYLTKNIKPFKKLSSPRTDTTFSLYLPVELNKLYKIELDLLTQYSTDRNDEETIELTIRPPGWGELHIGYLSFLLSPPQTIAGIKTIKDPSKFLQKYKVEAARELGSSRWKYSGGLFYTDGLGGFVYPDNNDSIRITISVTQDITREEPDFTILAGSLFSLIEIDAQPYEEEEES